MLSYFSDGRVRVDFTKHGHIYQNSGPNRINVRFRTGIISGKVDREGKEPPPSNTAGHRNSTQQHENQSDMVPVEVIRTRREVSNQLEQETIPLKVDIEPRIVTDDKSKSNLNSRSRNFYIT